MSTGNEISRHYGRGGLLRRLNAALSDDGVDPARPSLEELAPYDQFHGRGLEATVEIADQLQVAATDHLLDVGSGIGGPARYMARRFGCRVTGIDLTAEFCEVARHLSDLLGLADRTGFQQGDALAMPFADASIDGAYSMNVSMNIADKAGFYRELYRVLKPGSWLFLSELAQGPGGSPDYPTPWAATAAASFLATPDDTRAGLTAAGFEVLSCSGRVAETVAFGERAREIVRAGGKPPHRTVQLIHGEIAQEAMRNSTRAVAEARTVPIEVYSRKA
jgi:SAM-dependent methyltransferase